MFHNKMCTMIVKGKDGIEFDFNVVVDVRNIPLYHEKRFEIYPLINTIPLWVVHMGLGKPWCFMQDILNFKNPFKE